jgi:hypothetical protein
MTPSSAKGQLSVPVAYEADGQHAPSCRIFKLWEAIPKRAPEELAVILLLPGWARVGSRVGLLVCGGEFQLSAVPVRHNGGRWFLGRLPWSIRRDTKSARIYVRWRGSPLAGSAYCLSLDVLPSVCAEVQKGNRNYASCRFGLPLSGRRPEN